jgi:hypothetical protein
MLLVQAFVRGLSLQIHVIIVHPVAFFVQGIIPGVPLRLQNLACPLRQWLGRSFSKSLARHGSSFILDVIDVNTVDAVIEISHIQSKIVVVHQFDVVHLLVDELVPRLVRRHPHRHLCTDLWALLRFVERNLLHAT